MGGEESEPFYISILYKKYIYIIFAKPRVGGQNIYYICIWGGWQDMQYITYAIGIIVKSHEILVALTYNGTRRKKEDI